MSTEQPSAPTSKDKKKSFSNFKNIELIGQGAFGTVYKGVYDKNNKAFAIKKISKKKILNQGMVQQLQNQIKISYSLDHPNIIKLYEVIDEGDSLYLILQLAQKGQLYSRLMQKGRFDEQTTKTMTLDIIAALKYLHSQNPPIIHRDIKPENILLDKNDRVKLAGNQLSYFDFIDFGWSTFSNKQRTTYCGTYDYLAPQMLMKTGHDQKLDIWCLGVLVFELLTGKPPFAPAEGEASPGQENKKLNQNIMNIRITFPADFPALAKDFVLGILKKDPKERSTLEQLQNHPWLVVKPISKIAGSANQLNTVPAAQNDDSVQADDHRKIVDQLNKKIKALQTENENLRVQQKMKNNQQNNIPTTLNINGDADKRLKISEDMNQKYKKQIQRLHKQLEGNSKEVVRLRAEVSAAEEHRKAAERYKQQRNNLQEKYKGLQGLHDQLDHKYLELNTKYENDKLDYEAKLKELKYKGNSGSDLAGADFIQDLLSAISDLTKKFNESKKLLAEVARKENGLEQAQKELQKLRFEQTTVRQDIRMQLREQYETQMDELLLKAREQLVSEKEKWLQERAQLANLGTEEAVTEANNVTVASGQKEMEVQMKKTRELNQLYEKRLKEQENKILYLEEQIKYSSRK